MHESLRQRIERRLEQLPDETGYQVLDYIEFLESKYAVRARGGTMIQRLSETVEDTLRAGRLPVAAIKGTMNVMDAAGRVMAGLSAAGETVLNEIKKTASTPSAPPEASDSAKPLRHRRKSRRENNCLDPLRRAD